MDVKIEDELIRALLDTGATLSLLNSNVLSVSSPWSSEFIQMVDRPYILTYPFSVENSYWSSSFPTSISSHIPPRKRFLKKPTKFIFPFSQKGMILELSSPGDPISEIALAEIPIYSTGLINNIHPALQGLPRSL